MVEAVEALVKKRKIDYKYNEDKILNELKQYIDSTYDKHYSHNKFQATEFVIDSGHGEGFCIGNILKYAQRYGRKNGKDRNDLLKVVHYGMIALYINDHEVGLDDLEIEKAKRDAEIAREEKALETIIEQLF